MKEKCWRTHAPPVWCFTASLERTQTLISPSQTSWVWFGTCSAWSWYMCPAKFIFYMWQSRGAMLSSGSSGQATRLSREEGTGAASKQGNGEGVSSRTPTISSGAKGKPWCCSYSSGLSSWEMEQGKVWIQMLAAAKVWSPKPAPQAEQLNYQSLSLLESSVCLQNQLSAKITTEARFESVQLPSAVPCLDPICPSAPWNKVALYNKS